jgi:hypothetical protein
LPSPESPRTQRGLRAAVECHHGKERSLERNNQTSNTDRVILDGEIAVLDEKGRCLKRSKTILTT